MEFVAAIFSDLIHKASLGDIGLILTAYAIHREERARQVSNSIAINQNYHEIWKEAFSNPELMEVDSQEFTVSNDISFAQEVFITNLVLQLSTVFRAMKYGEFVTYEGLRRDVKAFFSLPLPNAVWQKIKVFQDKKFVMFVESCLK